MENEDTLAVQSLLSRDNTSCGGGGGGGGVWDRGEKKDKDWEREREKGVNRVSEQGLVPLDVAALTHNSPLLHVLTKAGARHNPVRESEFVFCSSGKKTCSTIDFFQCCFFHLAVCRPAEWQLKLDALVTLAGKRVEERKTELQKKAGPGPQAQAEVHRHVRLWSLRLQLYCRMRENFQKTGQLSWDSRGETLRLGFSLFSKARRNSGTESLFLQLFRSVTVPLKQGFKLLVDQNFKLDQVLVLH